MVCSVDDISLTPQEATLLFAFIEADYDLSALIASQSLTAEQAIDFICSPAIQAKLGELCKVTDHSDHLFNSKYRRKAVKALGLVIDQHSDALRNPAVRPVASEVGDIVELRKAASNLLRRTESSERSPSVNSRLAPHASPLTSDSPLATRPSRLTPSPSRLDSSPESILAALADSTARLDTSETISILEATLSEDAKVNGERITDHSFNDQRGAVYQLTRAVGHVPLSSESTNTRATYSIAVVDGDGSSIPLYINFDRLNLTSPTERWRITAIHRPARRSESRSSGERPSGASPSGASPSGASSSDDDAQDTS